MGRHLDEIRKIDEAVGKFRDGLKILLGILGKQTKKERDKTIASFTLTYSYLNYQIATYLLQKFPKAVEADKIEKEFIKMMKGFDKRKKGRKKKR
nr:hypothetical protein [Nanoarchaeota archaeon]